MYAEQNARQQLRQSGWVAGLNHGNHDASCVLTHEGKLVVWVEQDRLSRVKYAAGQSPAGALSECLNFAGIKLSDLDAVALGSDHTELCRWIGEDPEGLAHIRQLSMVDWLFPDSLFGDLGPN